MNTTRKDISRYVTAAALLLGLALCTYWVLGMDWGKGVLEQEGKEARRAKASITAVKTVDRNSTTDRRHRVREDPEVDRAGHRATEPLEPRGRRRWFQEFSILTEAGYPIEGARILSQRGKSRPSDARGRTKLEVLASEKLLAVAEAYDSRWIRVTPRPLALHQLVLGAPTGLEILVTSPRPLPEGALLVELETYEALYPVRLLHRHGMKGDLAPSPEKLISSVSATTSLISAGSPTSGHDPIQDNDSNDGFFSLPGTGRLFWTGVFPRLGRRLGTQEARIQVSLLDQYGSALGSRAVTMVPGKTQQVLFALKKSAATLTAWVLSPEGLPIQGARVDIGSVPSGEPPVAVHKDGSFRIGPFFDEIPSVFVMARGYVQRDVSGSQLRKSPRIRLERSRFLRLELRDASGDKRKAHVVLHSPTMTFGPDSSSAGIFSFLDIPLGPLVAHVTKGGETRKYPIPRKLTRYRLRW